MAEDIFTGDTLMGVVEVTSVEVGLVVVVVAAEAVVVVVVGVMVARCGDDSSSGDGGGGGSDTIVAVVVKVTLSVNLILLASGEPGCEVTTRLTPPLLPAVSEETLELLLV